MTITLGANITSLRAQAELRRSSARLGTVYERLASSQRINHASDDPAGLAVASALNASARVKSQAVRNVNDGISLNNIATGAIESLINIVNRQSELAEQAANGTYSSVQRQAMDRELQALGQEFNRVRVTTRFNGIDLLASIPQTITIQVDRSTIGLDMPGATTISEASDPAASDSSVIASWKLEEGTGSTAYDSSSAGANATLPNGATWTTGEVGSGVSFNGTNQYLSASNVDFSGQAVTVSFWMNESSYLGHGTIFESSANFNTTTGAFGMFQSDPVVGGANTLQLAVKGDVGFNIKVYAPPTPGWHHYTAVFDKSQSAANEVQLFVDGVLQTATSQPFNSNNTNSFDANPFFMESRAGTSEFLAGTLDQVRIYNRALTSTDAQALTAETAQLSIATASDARTALDTLTNLRQTLDQSLGSLGATESRLQIAIENLRSQELNYLQAAGRIMDADVATEATAMVRNQILQQASAQVLAHANLEPSLVLKLLS